MIFPGAGFSISTFCPHAGHPRAATTTQEIQNLVTFPPSASFIYGGCPGGLTSVLPGSLRLTREFLLVRRPWCCRSRKTPCCECRHTVCSRSLLIVLRWCAGECR